MPAEVPAAWSPGCADRRGLRRPDARGRDPARRPPRRDPAPRAALVPGLADDGRPARDAGDDGARPRPGTHVHGGVRVVGARRRGRPGGHPRRVAPEVDARGLEVGERVGVRGARPVGAVPDLEVQVGDVEIPVEPTSAMRCPALTVCPALTYLSPSMTCPYTLRDRLPADRVPQDDPLPEPADAARSEDRAVRDRVDPGARGRAEVLSQVPRRRAGDRHAARTVVGRDRVGAGPSGATTAAAALALGATRTPPGLWRAPPPSPYPRRPTSASRSEPSPAPESSDMPGVSG